MSDKTFIPEGEIPPDSQIGATMEALGATIAARRDATDESYTHRLLNGNVDDVLKKVMEEAGEVALAAKDGEPDHLRYEAADVVYHLLVVLERYEIPLDEFAAELNVRMRKDERPEGAIRLRDEYVKRGK
jgi:phosphoribosyl-ATP pyrophosphohydrolase/phosphoribosyl-ATP pyrophosphohydrolase/phosphoribosyl-AMP cyclohydrolase